MAITTEELAARLDAEAARRGTTSEALLDELAAQLPARSDDIPRFAFAGMGRSGRGDLSERHKEIRSDLIADQRPRDR